MGIVLGGEKAWKQRVTGEIVSSYQWINKEPAMVLWPSGPRRLGGGAFILCLSAAFRYANSNGSPTPYLIKQTIKIAQQFGMEPNQFLCKKIADVILDGLPDLCEMPPEPTGLNAKQTEAIGEALIKVDGQTIFHGEVNMPTEAEFAAHDAVTE